MDKKIAKHKINQESLMFEINITDIANSSNPDFGSKMRYNEHLISSYKDNLMDLDWYYDSLTREQSKFLPDSYEWLELQNMIDITDKNIKDMNLSLMQTLANNRELAKEQMQSDFNKSNKELEKSLFNNSTLQEFARQIEKDSELLDKFVSGLEKQHSLDLLIRDVRKEKIVDFDEEISAMEQANELRRSELELLQKRVNIKKLENNLDKLKNNKTVQTLVQKSDLTWDFEYSADEEAIKSLEDSLVQARIDLLNYEKSLALDNRRTELKDKSRFLEDVKALQDKALADEYTNSQMFLNDLKNLDSEFAEGTSSYITEISNSFTEYHDITKNLTDRINALVVALSLSQNNTAVNNKPYMDYSTNTPYMDNYGHRPAPVVNGLIPFDTGGYTGNFNGGKLAVLHQKELVLNQDDTKNFLDAIKFLKGISFSGISNLIGKISNKDSGNKDISQDIKVYAEFPNATNQDEIKKAIMSLPSRAIVKANLI